MDRTTLCVAHLADVEGIDLYQNNPGFLGIQSKPTCAFNANAVAETLYTNTTFDIKPFDRVEHPSGALRISFSPFNVAEVSERLGSALRVLLKQNIAAFV